MAPRLSLYSTVTCREDGVNATLPPPTCVSTAAHLGLGVRQNPGTLAERQLLHPVVELVGQQHGEGHALLGLIGGVTEHQTLKRRRQKLLIGSRKVWGCGKWSYILNLVSCADVLLIPTFEHAVRYLLALRLQSHQNVTRLIVETCRTRAAPPQLQLAVAYSILTHLWTSRRIRSSSPYSGPRTGDPPRL